MPLTKVQSRGTENVGQGSSNFIINGAMNVAQRGTSFADPANDSYTLDRFIARKSNDGAVTITQDSSAPSGFANSLKVDVTTADDNLGTSQFSILQYKIEAQDLQSLGFGTSDAKDFTLSFYVKSNKTGTYSVNISQSDNSSKQATLTYTINSADTWERKSLTFTGDTAGVINDDNGTGLSIYWWLAVGTLYTSGGSTSASFQAFTNANHAGGHAVNLLDNTSNEWFITGVQMEIGSQASDFQHEDIGTTLAKCQRYFQQWTQEATGFSTNNYAPVADSVIHGDTYAFMQYTHPVSLRATPSLTFNGNFASNNSGTDRALSSLQINQATPYITGFYGTIPDNNEVGQVGYMRASNDGDASIFFDSEL